MIECSNENIWYKKRRRKNFKRVSTFFISFIILVSFVSYYKFVVVKQIYKICEDYAYSYSAEAVNQVVIESLTIPAKYSDLITVEKNENGDIVLMRTNSYKVNLINKEVAISTKNKLSQKLNGGIPIPILTFSGIEILSGYGAIIKYKSINVVSVDCDFKSKFESVGINQTLHSIYIEIISCVDIEAPFNKKTTQCRTAVLLSETILVGKVPEVYLNGKIFG
jgi:sporulation protein YunB